MACKKALLSKVGLAVIALSLFFLFPSWAYSSQQITVEPDVYDTISKKGEAGYLIYFSEKPDLTRASTLSWQKRGEFVVSTLQNAAFNAQARVRRYLDNHGIQYRAFWIDNIILVERSGRLFLDGLMQFPEISRIIARRSMILYEPSKERKTQAVPLGIESNISHVKADEAWALGINGSGIVVANIDTGVRYTHQALVNQYRGNLGSGNFNHNHNWWDPYGNHLTSPADDNGHGTHTMGTAVGDDGGNNQIGMAPGAKWIACRGCSTSNCGDNELLECAQFVAAPWDLGQANPDPNKRPHVVNNSWGDCGLTYDNWYQGVVDSWRSAGIYPVFSNGNAGNCSYDSPPGCNTVGNPGRYGNVTGVGSSGNNNGQYATHSNWGPTDNADTINPSGYPNLKPQVVAPGVDIRSSVPTSNTSYEGGWSGTSMSAPHVTGLVALILQAAPCLAHVANGHVVAETIIQQTAVAIPYASGCGGEGPGNVPNNATGWGEIDALAAVNAASTTCGPSGTIEGTVRNLSNSEPVKGATVSAGTLSVVTGIDGRYIFSYIPVGTHDMTVTAYGYGTATATVTVTENTTARQDFSLPSGLLITSISDIDIVLSGGGKSSIDFTIRNNGELPATFELVRRLRTGTENGFSTALFLNNSAQPSVPYAPVTMADTNEPMEGKFVVRRLPRMQAPTQSWIHEGDVTLILDDGSAENTIGLGNGGQFVWLNRFTPSTDAFPFSLEQVSVLYDISVGIGDQMEIVVWEDTDGDGNPGTGANFLHSEIVTVQYNNLTTWNTYNLSTPVFFNDPGDVLIGLVNRSGVSGYEDFPAAIDQSSSQRRSWIGSYSAGNPPHPPTLPTDGSWGMIDGLGFPGNWMLRGSGSTEIPTWFTTSPITGTLSEGEEITVTVNFDATGLMPGVYKATIRIENDTPHGVITIPVTMTVPSDTFLLFDPNGNEQIPAGSQYKIRWNIPPDSDMVTFKIKYSLDKGVTWKTIGKHLTGSTLDWTLPTPTKDKKKCLVRVIGYNSKNKKVRSDASDRFFTVSVFTLNAPNGGEALSSGDPMTIQWSTRTVVPVDRTRLTYTTNGGTTWKLLATLSGDPGTYSTRVPIVRSVKTKCKVRVDLLGAGGILVASDRSDSNFIIIP